MNSLVVKADRPTAAFERNGSVAAAAAAGLECRGIRVSFAGLHALDGVDLSLGRGEIMGLIGTNGAGKTTLVNVVSGYQRPSEGTVLLDGRDISGWTPGRRARAGVVRTFQAGRLFAGLSVEQNVEAAAVGVGKSRKVARGRARHLLGDAGLLDRAAFAASALPHGEVRVLGILRALAADPSFILVDEPAAGSNEAETERLLELLSRIARELSIGVLVIEHDMTLIMRLCDRIQVLDHGKTIALGAPAEVRSDPEVLRAYLASSGEARSAAGG